jgi:hypothetical protein
MPHQQLGLLLADFTAEGMLNRANTQEIANLLLGIAYMGQQLPAALLLCCSCCWQHLSASAAGQRHKR